MTPQPAPRICPKCGKPYERKSRTAAGYDCYEHKSRNEGGFRVVSSRDCCYVEPPAPRTPETAQLHRRASDTWSDADERRYQLRRLQDTEHWAALRERRRERIVLDLTGATYDPADLILC